MTENQRIQDLLEANDRYLSRARTSEEALTGLLRLYEDMGLNIDHPAAKAAYAALKEPWNGTTQQPTGR